MLLANIHGWARQQHRTATGPDDQKKNGVGCRATQAAGTRRGYRVTCSPVSD